jgi:VanZ family protein
MTCRSLFSTGIVVDRASFEPACISSLSVPWRVSRQLADEVARAMIKGKEGAIDLMKVINAAAGWGAWGILLGLLVVTVVPAGVRPVVVPWHNVEHMLAFGALGMTFAMAYRKQTIALILGMTSFSLMLELAQLILPTRHARWQDLVVNLVSVYAGLILGRLLQKTPVFGTASR